MSRGFDGANNAMQPLSSARLITEVDISFSPPTDVTRSLGTVAVTAMLSD